MVLLMESKACQICGGLFTPKRVTAKYCSTECANKSEVDRAREKRNENRVIIEKSCLVCGDKFTPKLVTPYQMYCSEICLRQAMHKRAVETGKKKEYYYKNKHKYTEKKSETDLNYKDRIRFSSNKKHVLERDGHKCVDCSKTERLTVHHIDGSGKSNNPNNDMDNLITLCISCHMRHHSGINNHQFIYFTKEQILEARKESTSWEQTAKKLGITKQTLIKRRKMLGIF